MYKIKDYPFVLQLDATLFSAALVTILALVIYTASYFTGTTLSSFGPWINFLDRPFPNKKTNKRGMAPVKVEATPRAYDRSWWTNERLFQSERRAIFSKTWLYVTHSSRFQKPGDYRTFEIAGYSVIIILGKDKRVRAFHNVCRHRAYAVTKKECGSSTILGCRYHGWSYDTKGRLTKAPEFDKVPDFDKDSNGLWEVRTEVIDELVFINFQNEGNISRISLPKLSKRSKISLKTLTVCAEWKIEGNFNWKLAVDKLPSIQPGTKLMRGWLFPFTFTRLGEKQGTQELGLTAFIQYLSPRYTMTTRVLPRSKGYSTVEFVLYENSSRRYPVEQSDISKLEQKSWSEIRQLEHTQRTLLMNKYSSTKQDAIYEALQLHLNMEKALGAEIHPASQSHSFSQAGKEDDEWCKKLDVTLDRKYSACTASALGVLDW